MNENDSIGSVSPLSQSFIEAAENYNGDASKELNIENQKEIQSNQFEAFDSIEEYLKHMEEKDDEWNSGINIDDFLHGFQKDVIYGALNVEDENLYQSDQKALKDFLVERGWNRKDIVSRFSESNLDLRIKIRLYLLITDMEERKFLDIYKLISASDFAENDNHGNSLKFRSIVYEFQDFFRLLPDSERTFKNMLLIPNIFSMDMSYIVEGENISMNEKLSSEIQQYDEFVDDLVQAWLKNKTQITNSDYDAVEVIKNMYAIYLNYLHGNEWIDIEDQNGNKIRECAAHRLKKQGIDIDKTICDFVDLLSGSGLVSNEQKAKLKSCFSGWNIRNWFSVYLYAVWECVKCWGKNLFGKSGEKISCYLDDEIQLRKFEKFNAIFSPNYLRRSDRDFGYNLYQNLYSENRKQGFVLDDMLYKKAIKPAKESSWGNIEDVEAEVKVKDKEGSNNINVVAENEKKENVIVEENNSENEQSSESHNSNENNAGSNQTEMKMKLKSKKFATFGKGNEQNQNKDKDIENDINQQIDKNKKLNPEEQSKVNNDLVKNDPVEQAWDLIHRFYFSPDAVFTERETKIIQHWLAGTGRMHWNNEGLNDHPSGEFQENESKNGKKLYEKAADENKNIMRFIKQLSQTPNRLVDRSGMIIDAMTNPDKPVDELSENEFGEQEKELENRICKCDEIEGICKSTQNETEEPKPKLEEEEKEEENSKDEI